MSLLAWNDTYSVGVVELDNDHKKLIALINALFDAMRAQKGREIVGEILDGLVSYTAEHFAREERMFAKTAYPETAAHKVAHRALVQQVLDVQAKYKDGKIATLSIELMKFLKRWLTDHIQNEDKRYSAHLNGYGIR
ncbi:MAG: hemerythrin family protein [Alphaproteobacteria bacterium]|nr:hemerythrin family protein [Alphaproteobacteria bacterium]